MERKKTQKKLNAKKRLLALLGTRCLFSTADRRKLKFIEFQSRNRHERSKAKTEGSKNPRTHWVQRGKGRLRIGTRRGLRV